MAEAYVKVLKNIEPLPENEIRVRRDPRIGKYLHRAFELFSGKIEGADQTVVIKGVSNAMENAVKLAELIKHKFTGLYQLSKVENIEISDEYEPLEEGLDHLVFKRNSTMLTIILSKNPLDSEHPGYQDPIPDSEVQPYEEREARSISEGGRGRSRGQSFADGEDGQQEGGARRRSQSRRNNRFRGQRGGRGGRGGRGAPRGTPVAPAGGRYDGANRRVYDQEGGNRRQVTNNYNYDDNRRGGGQGRRPPAQRYNDVEEQRYDSGTRRQPQYGRSQRAQPQRSEGVAATQGSVRRYRDDNDNYDNRQPRNNGTFRGGRGGQRGGYGGPAPRNQPRSRSPSGNRIDSRTTAPYEGAGNRGGANRGFPRGGRGGYRGSYTGGAYPPRNQFQEDRRQDYQEGGRRYPPRDRESYGGYKQPRGGNREGGYQGGYSTGGNFRGGASSAQQQQDKYYD